MSEPEPGRSRVGADLAQNRRDLGRQMRRARRHTAPEPVGPSLVRRRVRIAIGVLISAWASVLLIDMMLIRAHVWKPSDAGVSTFAGFIAGSLWPAISYGISTKVHAEVRAGRRLVSARTITGTRMIGLLDLKPRSLLPQFLHFFWGLWVMIAALGIPAASSYVLALQLSGVSVWRTWNS